jgi:hypothetical protein
LYGNDLIDLSQGALAVMVWISCPSRRNHNYLNQQSRCISHYIFTVLTRLAKNAGISKENIQNYVTISLITALIWQQKIIIALLK